MSETPTAPQVGLEEVAARLDHATGDLDSLDPTSRAVVDELLDAMGVLHKTALVTIVRRLRDDSRGRELLYELVDDPGVRMVLSVHGIIRVPSEAGATSASATGAAGGSAAGASATGASGVGSGSRSQHGPGHSGPGHSGCGCGGGSGGCGSGGCGCSGGARQGNTVIPAGSLRRLDGARE